ncbi:MAG: erythromycin esterase family protein [Acidimicrobiales bacterium]
MERDAVAAWVETGGVRLGSVAARGPLDALEALRAVVGEGTVVGIGVPTHGARELTVLAHRIVRFLVERLGFRAVAMDEAATVGDRLDGYVQRGDDDPREVVGTLWPHHHTVEVLDLVEWMRGRVQQEPGDPVHFVALGPDGDGPAGDDRMSDVEAHLAEAALRWHDDTGSKLAVISGATHTAVAPIRTVTVGSSAVTHRNAGSRLRDRLGEGYVSVGLTFHHGVVDLGTGPHVIPDPPATVLETTLGDAPTAVMFDLHAEVAEPVRHWLDAPASLRLVGPAFDPAEPSKARMAGGSLASWFDALIHVGQVAPVTSLEPREPPHS